MRLDKPHNPLINSGALVSASLILQMVQPELQDMAQKYDYLFQIFEVSIKSSLIHQINTRFM